MTFSGPMRPFSFFRGTVLTVLVPSATILCSSLSTITYRVVSLVDLPITVLSPLFNTLESGIIFLTGITPHFSKPNIKLSTPKRLSKIYLTFSFFKLESMSFVSQHINLNPFRCPFWLNPPLLLFNSKSTTCPQLRNQTSHSLSSSDFYIHIHIWTINVETQVYFSGSLFRVDLLPCRLGPLRGWNSTFPPSSF